MGGGWQQPWVRRGAASCSPPACFSGVAHPHPHSPPNAELGPVIPFITTKSPPPPSTPNLHTLPPPNGRMGCKLVTSADMSTHTTLFFPFFCVLSPSSPSLRFVSCNINRFKEFQRMRVLGENATPGQGIGTKQVSYNASSCSSVLWRWEPSSVRTRSLFSDLLARATPSGAPASASSMCCAAGNTSTPRPPPQPGPSAASPGPMAAAVAARLLGQQHQLWGDLPPAQAGTSLPPAAVHGLLPSRPS